MSENLESVPEAMHAARVALLLCHSYTTSQALKPSRKCKGLLKSSQLQHLRPCVEMFMLQLMADKNVEQFRPEACLDVQHVMKVCTVSSSILRSPCRLGKVLHGGVGLSG